MINRRNLWSGSDSFRHKHNLYIHSILCFFCSSAFSWFPLPSFFPSFRCPSLSCVNLHPKLTNTHQFSMALTRSWQPVTQLLDSVFFLAPLKSRPSISGRVREEEEEERCGLRNVIGFANLFISLNSFNFSFSFPLYSHLPLYTLIHALLFLSSPPSASLFPWDFFTSSLPSKSVHTLNVLGSKDEILGI